MKINNVIPPISNEPKRNNKNQNPAFGGSFINGWKPSNLLELSRQGTMKGNLFIANAFVFLLGSRILTSRDKDEKREVLIRDIPTIVLAVMGVPLLENAVTKFVQKKSGFAIAESSTEKNGLANWVRKKLNTAEKERTTTKTVNYSKLEDWYKFDKNTPSGIEGFSKRLDSLGGNLKKIYSPLSEEIKSVFEGCKNNEEVIAKITANKELAGKLGEMMSKKNPILEKAKFFKTIPTIAGFAGTLLLIGLFIPKLNIFITESLHKNSKNNHEKPKEQSEIN